MRTLLKGQTIAVRFKDRDFDQIFDGLRQTPNSPEATLLALTGAPNMQLQAAASELAKSLGKTLLQVDLSSTASKYIGETEKNLAQVLQRAKATGAVLFFDEADALFGQRSGVKDSHDRYANQETNYLLSRVENHPGIVIAAFQSAMEAERKRPGLRQLVVRFPPR